MGYILGLVMVFLVACTATFGYQLGQTNENHKEFNSWVQLCHRDGGTLQLTAVGSSADQYECYRGGKIIDHLD